MIVILNSCEAQDNRIKLNKVKEISFNLGIDATPGCFGSYFDNITGQDIFYFADVFTHKSIKILDADFNPTNTIPLNNIPYLQEVRQVQVVAKDTIVVLSFPQVQRIYLCDFSGKITKTINSERLNADTLEFDFSYETGGYYNSKVYLKYSINRRSFFDNPSYSYEFVKHKDSLILDYPYMASIDLFKDASQNILHTLFDNIYKENFKYGCAIDDYSHYYIANGKLFMPIGHNGRLYIVDLNTEKIEKVLTIESKHTKIGFDIEKFRYTSENYEDLKLEQYEYFLYNAGGVKSVAWDRYRKLYYFYVQHYSKEMYAAKECSIQIFDENFNKKGEITLDNRKYYSNMLVCPKGLLINSNRIESKDYDKNIQKYTLFTISD
jgi:hypothetical protein